MPPKPLFSWRHGILHSDLPATTKLVLLVLSCHMTDVGDSCFPSMRTIARETGLSRRAVITHIKKARAAGWLRVQKRKSRNGEHFANNYLVAVPAPIAGGEPQSLPPVEGGERPAGGGERQWGKVVNDVHFNATGNSKDIHPPTCACARGSKRTENHKRRLALETGDDEWLVICDLDVPVIAQELPALEEADVVQAFREIDLWYRRECRDPQNTRCPDVRTPIEWRSFLRRWLNEVAAERQARKSAPNQKKRVACG